MADPETPERLYMDDDDIVWRQGKPNYKVVNEKYLKDKSKNHLPGSLEKTIENAVKTWEMEFAHKPRVEDWKTIDHENFKIFVNGGEAITAQECLDMGGSYNMHLKDSPLCDETRETFGSSHEAFHTVFPDSFAWEVLEVLTGPPKVSFTWRHWGTWMGPFKDTPPSGEVIEMFGSSVVYLNEEGKIQDVYGFFDPTKFMAKLMKFEKKIINGTCPVAQL